LSFNGGFRTGYEGISTTHKYIVNGEMQNVIIAGRFLILKWYIGVRSLIGKIIPKYHWGKNGKKDSYKGKR